MENKDAPFANDLTQVIATGFSPLGVGMNDLDQSEIANALKIAKSGPEWTQGAVTKTNRLLLCFTHSVYNESRAAEKVAWMIFSNHPDLRDLTDAEKRYMLDTACQMSINARRKVIASRDRYKTYDLPEPEAFKELRPLGIIGKIERYKAIQYALRERVSPSPQAERK